MTLFHSAPVPRQDGIVCCPVRAETLHQKHHLLSYTPLCRRGASHVCNSPSLAQTLEQIAHMVTLLLCCQVHGQSMVQLRDDLRSRARSNAQELQDQLLEDAVVHSLISNVLAVSAGGSGHLG